MPNKLHKLKTLSFDKVYHKSEVREYAGNNEKMFTLPEIMDHSKKDLREHINAIIANGYAEYLQQNVQKLTDGMGSTLIYKSYCFLGNHSPHLRDTLTEKNSLNMSMD